MSAHYEALKQAAKPSARELCTAEKAAAVSRKVRRAVKRLDDTIWLAVDAALGVPGVRFPHVIEVLQAAAAQCVVKREFQEEKSRREAERRVN